MQLKLSTAGILYWKIIQTYNAGNDFTKSHLARTALQAVAREAPLQCLRARAQKIIEAEFLKVVSRQ